MKGSGPSVPRRTPRGQSFPRRRRAKARWAIAAGILVFLGEGSEAFRDLGLSRLDVLHEEEDEEEGDSDDDYSELDDAENSDDEEDLDEYSEDTDDESEEDFEDNEEDEDDETDDDEE